MISLADVRMEVHTRGRNPRVHPNGFLQLDLVADDEQLPDASLSTRIRGATKPRGHSGTRRRLHIWNPPMIELPKQKVVTSIHDHIFDMRSTVVMGTLWQVLYKLVPDRFGAWHIAIARYSGAGESTLHPGDERFSAVPYNRFPITSGQRYTQPASTFHDSEAHGTVVTVMEKTKIYPDRDARALVRHGLDPDNSFDRRNAMDEDALWNVIEKTLGMI